MHKQKGTGTRKLGSDGAPPSCVGGVGTWWPSKKLRHSPHVLSCRILSFYVKRYEHYGDLLGKKWPLASRAHVTRQGH